MKKETIKKALDIILKVCTLLIIVCLFLLFSWYGLVGYLLFVGILATYILISRWKSYKLIILYGAKQLEKVFNNGKNKESE